MLRSRHTWLLGHRVFRRRALPLLLSCAGVVSTDEAPAQPSEPPVRYQLDYRAPASCPGEGAFTSLIARRTTRAQHAGSGEWKYRFTVEVLLSDAGARGTLRIAERDGGTTERDVPARDCANAVEAMALIAAVILDPRAAELARPGTAPPEAGTPVENAKPESDPTQRKSAPAAATAPQSATPPEPDARAESKRTPPPGDGSPRWQMRLRAAGTLQNAVAPGVAFGAAAGAELHRDRRALIEPRFALSAHFAAAETSTDFGDAEFYWYAGRLTACPLGWPKSGRLLWRGCAFAEAGALQGRGKRTLNPRSSTAFWLAAGPSTELELGVSDWLALAIEAGLTVPAFHDRFVFVPEEAHKVPDVGAWLAAGVRVGPLRVPPALNSPAYPQR